jgi:DNA-binding MarR family transcriptional regulator
MPADASLATADLAELDRVLSAIERRLTELRDLARSSSRAVQKTTLPVARMLVADRRRRDRVFAEYDIFGEPGWDILLDLYAAHSERRDVSVSSACIAAAVPPTTALRWIQMLTEKALLTRQPDPFDRRRVHLRLAPEALRRMELYLGNVKCACATNRPPAPPSPA